MPSRAETVAVADDTWEEMLKKERKGKVCMYRLYTAFSLKAVRHGSHSFTCRLHHACLKYVVLAVSHSPEHFLLSMLLNSRISAAISDQGTTL